MDLGHKVSFPWVTPVRVRRSKQENTGNGGSQVHGFPLFLGQRTLGSRSKLKKFLGIALNSDF